ncbi:MAG: hypothetical protein V2I63_06365 [Pseudomonadales bacterium]|jgi:hypothetical protein|nr:hypothetical protein [Pseudomonadales bacterium]
MSRSVALLLATLLCIAAPAPVVAAESHEEAAEGRVAVAVFLGATRADERNEPTLGFEAGYRIDEHWSVGAVVERADREQDSTLLLAGVGWHPFGAGPRIQLGIGRKDPRGVEETVVRTGLAYEFELTGGWALQPYLARDFLDDEEDETVFGLYFGRNF